MKRFIRIVLKSTAVIGLLLCMAATWFYFEVWIPHRTIANVFLWDPDYGFQGEMPREKIRNASHKVLRNWFVGDHSAFLALGKVGNKDSIPILIRALKRQNVERPNEKGTSGLCSNCIVSLRKLTGMNFHDDHEQWENWWQQTGRHLPFDEEKGTLVLPEKAE